MLAVTGNRIRRAAPNRQAMSGCPMTNATGCCCNTTGYYDCNNINYDNLNIYIVQNSPLNYSNKLYKTQKLQR